MSETEEADSYRSEIALRSRRRVLDGRERKLSMAVFGLMAYSAFANFLGGVMALASSPVDAGLGFVLGILYSLGVYRVWSKDDTRWWPVAVPAGISIAILLLAWAGGLPRPIPIALNVALLVLVPLRRRAVAAVEAVPNNSFKPNPLRGSA
ncbi:hypothetical protein ACW5F0_08205 [Luteimonas sp. A534]